MFTKKDNNEVTKKSEDSALAEMCGFSYEKDTEGLFIKNIATKTDELEPLRVAISKETGKLVIAKAELLPVVEGVILMFWKVNMLFNKEKTILCMGVDNKPTSKNPVCENCKDCPKNVYHDRKTECTNKLGILVKSPDYAIPLRVSLSATNIADFKTAIMLPIAQHKNLGNYNVVFRSQEKISKGGDKYYKYLFEFKQRETPLPYYEEYVKYANAYYTSFQNNSINPPAPEATTDADTTVDHDDLPF
ncbi:hypothetical protein KAU11_11390 [Candidatus Babeliales bacterium]|nr:hypothetical protein [Candidatus Babeliales bacterium]